MNKCNLQKGNKSLSTFSITVSDWLDGRMLNPQIFLELRRSFIILSPLQLNSGDMRLCSGQQNVRRSDSHLFQDLWQNAQHNFLCHSFLSSASGS